MSKELKFPFNGKYIKLKATETGLAISVDGSPYEDVACGASVQTMTQSEYDAATKDVNTVYIVEDTQ